MLVLAGGGVRGLCSRGEATGVASVLSGGSGDGGVVAGCRGFGDCRTFGGGGGGGREGREEGRGGRGGEERGGRGGRGGKGGEGIEGERGGRREGRRERRKSGG